MICRLRVTALVANSLIRAYLAPWFRWRRMQARWPC
jgi:hypothetical protein